MKRLVALAALALVACDPPRSLSVAQVSPRRRTLPARTRPGATPFPRAPRGLPPITRGPHLVLDAAVQTPGISVEHVPPPSPPNFTLSLVATDRVVQLLGDRDVERATPFDWTAPPSSWPAEGAATPGLTVTRFGVEGSDLGQSFEHRGTLHILFGDTRTTPPTQALDVIARTSATAASPQLALDFARDASGALVRPGRPAVAMGAFNVPVAGISLGGVAYVVCKVDHATCPDLPNQDCTCDRRTDRTVITRWDEASNTFVDAHPISSMPLGHFIKMSLREVASVEGLDGGPWVLVWATGCYRSSDVYLAAVRSSDLPTFSNPRYFTGLSGATPQWGALESDARPLTPNLGAAVGDISVTRVSALGLWLMTWDLRAPDRGVALRWSSAPWGPWSEPLRIYDARTHDGLGEFIFDPHTNPSRVAPGPLMNRTRDPSAVAGGAYAPYVIERFTRVANDTLDLYYPLSTWNPYVVQLMHTSLRVAVAPR